MSSGPSERLSPELLEEYRDALTSGNENAGRLRLETMALALLRDGDALRAELATVRAALVDGRADVAVLEGVSRSLRERARAAETALATVTRERSEARAERDAAKHGAHLASEMAFKSAVRNDSLAVELARQGDAVGHLRAAVARAEAAETALATVTRERDEARREHLHRRERLWELLLVVEGCPGCEQKRQGGGT